MLGEVFRFKIFFYLQFRQKKIFYLTLLYTEVNLLVNLSASKCACMKRQIQLKCNKFNKKDAITSP